ncbi:Pigment-dispersing factor [Zootermopsis nevadensis]|uniref:Pigment-dispersing factor n=2 Tax=Zootermopsis nevadensis TaxID=136037 RepID=A0A067RMR9_ZOONE|nr:Pigment-dispersing factor [Zootermopsis nevadensis]
MKQLGAVILFFYLLTTEFTSAAIQLEDNRYLDKEFQTNAVNVRELATWIMQLLLHKGQQTICTHKRNSELINTLLGLPKILNEAGRK